MMKSLREWCEENNRQDLLKQWHTTKNGDLTPDMVVVKSGKRVWWKCEKGHEYLMRIEYRSVRNCNCPYCSNRRILAGYNDLATLNSELASEWNYEKNGKLKPSDVALNYNRRVWWKCSVCGNEWQVSPNNRYSNNCGCPACKEKHAINSRLAGFVKTRRSLADNYPYLVKEWHSIKNGDLSPDDITSGSDKKVWWKCSRGHEWQATISSRVLGCGCSQCSKNGTSLPEQGVAYYLGKVCHIEQRCKIDEQEIDIYLSDYKIGIEYDGRFFHTNSTKSKELDKNTIINGRGIKLLRIKEADVNKVEDDIIYYNTDYMGVNYQWALVNLCSILFSITNNERFRILDIDVQRDIIAIRSRIDLYVKQNSLSTKRPDIAQEWNYDRNTSLTPDMFFVASNVKVWWKCQKGHEWQASINKRTCGNTNCPYCAGRYVIIGETDLLTQYPNIAQQWNYEKNKGLIDKLNRDISTPDKITACSGQKVWWKCDEGHEWQEFVSNRTRKNLGCPYCSGRRHESILCVETGKVYSDFVDASLDIFGNKSRGGAIRNVCENKPHCKTSGGYHWKYADE